MANKPRFTDKAPAEDAYQRILVAASRAMKNAAPECPGMHWDECEVDLIDVHKFAEDGTPYIDTVEPSSQPFHIHWHGRREPEPPKLDEAPGAAEEPDPAEITS